MNEKDVMNLLNNVDDDIIDEKIDELLAEKGEVFNLNTIKDKAMNKLNESNTKNRRKYKRPIIAAALVATLTFATVYADDISSTIKSFFNNKTTLYSTVVEGDAYFLKDEIKLNDDFTLSSFAVSKDNIIINLKTIKDMKDSALENLNLSITPKNNDNVSYIVGGYGVSDENEYMFAFYRDTEGNNIVPFKECSLYMGNEVYDILLAEGEKVNFEDLNVGKSETNNNLDTENTKDIESIASVAGNIEVNSETSSIQLVAGFSDHELSLSGLGEPTNTEFVHTFENDEQGTIGTSSSNETKPIIAFDENSNPYTLKVPSEIKSYPNTLFEINTAVKTPLTVKLPAVTAYYKKEITSLLFPVPKEGEIISIDKELDFIIQKAIVKSIRRVSDITAEIEFELNTDDNGSVSIIDFGAYSRDVVKGETKINSNKAVILITFNKDLEEANFSFSWPKYLINGNWSIELM